MNIKNKRVESIDLLRGVVMILMALDHIRDYFHSSAYLYDPTDLTQTNVLLFFTRWITHFCAPTFVLLAGTAAYLYGSKNDIKKLSFFLFTRGLLLIFLDFTVINFGWAFNIHFYRIDLSVVWVLGMSMIFLSLLIHLPKSLLLLIGLSLIAGHNILDSIHVPGNDLKSVLWAMLHESHEFNFGHITFAVTYSVLPWIGIMSCGYCLGSLYISGFDQAKRKKILIALGFAAIALFIILRAINLYGDPAYYTSQKNITWDILSFLNTTKYPPSLLYLLMTIGPALLFLAFTEKPLNALAQKITVFGRVPMFFYLVHIYFVHLLAMVAAVMSGYQWSDMILTTQWLTSSPQLKGYGFSLITVYLIWMAVIIVLYPLCKWFDIYKRNHQLQHRWLSYI